MQTAEELDQPPGWSATSDSPTRRAVAVVEDGGAPSAMTSAQAAALTRWWRLAVVVQLALLAAVVAAGLGLRGHLEDLKAASAAQHAQHQQALAALGGLPDSVKALEAEVHAVRQVVASSAAEDVIFLKILVIKPNVDPSLARKIAASIHRHTATYKRDPDLVLSIMAVESAFDPQVVSWAGATGLMQVMPHWKDVLGIEGDLKDIDVSVKTGLQILGFYESMYKDVELALTAYNRGPGPVDNALVKGRDPRNNYAPRVLAMYDRLRKLNSAPQ